MTFTGQVFEFDPAKAASNRKKHSVTFHEAMTVFEDPLAATLPDEEHSHSEDRFITIGIIIQAASSLHRPSGVGGSYPYHQRTSGNCNRETTI